MSKRKKAKKVQKHLDEGVTPIYHQQNPPPGNLAACGKVVDISTNHELVIDRSWVNCPDCLSRPDPTIIVR